MRRSLFLRITAGIREYDDYFRQNNNAIGESGQPTWQKAVAAIRILACGSSFDAVDEFVRIGESTASECLDRF